MKYSDGTYEGYYKNGKLDSLGFMFYADKKFYQGEFSDNQYEGNGYYKWKTGQIHIGSWKKGLQSGLGILKSANGGIQNAGEWVDGKLHDIKDLLQYEIYLRVLKDPRPNR